MIGSLPVLSSGPLDWNSQIGWPLTPIVYKSLMMSYAFPNIVNSWDRGTIDTFSCSFHHLAWYKLSHVRKRNNQFNIISFNTYLFDLLMRKGSNNPIKLIQMTESQWSIGLYEIYMHSQLHEKYVYNRPTYIDMWIKMIELNEDLKLS